MSSNQDVRTIQAKTFEPGHHPRVNRTPGVRHEVKGVVAVGCKSVGGGVAVDPLWKYLSGRQISEVFRQASGSTILLKPAMFFHPSSTGRAAICFFGRRAASACW